MKKSRFQAKVYDFYASHKRQLPWRETRDPYKILLSELMLQQTQVTRVLDKYPKITRKFPTIKSVANAPLDVILDVWSGLGYNRRVLALKKLAAIIVQEFDGEIPDTVEILKKLPGIGDATANAICAFAFNQPVVFLETNIRAVFIHHFFADREQVRDSEILPLVEKMLDTSNPREWYYALMDYGGSLKRRHGNPARKSAHYKRQTKFEGSNRQIRGRIIKMLVRCGAMTESSLLDELPFARSRARKMIKMLALEGLIERRGERIAIAQSSW